MYRITGFKQNDKYHLWIFPLSFYFLSRMIVAFVSEIMGCNRSSPVISSEYECFRNAYDCLQNGKELKGTFTTSLIDVYVLVEQCVVINLDAMVIELWKSRNPGVGKCIHVYDIPFGVLLPYLVFKNIHSIKEDAYHCTGFN